MTKGWNLPDNVSPNDPDAPWNKEEQQEEICTCHDWIDSPFYNQPVCPIHGITEEQLHD